MTTRLPLQDIADTGGLSFTIDLAGDVFRLTFRHNDRCDRWFLSVFDEDETSIIESVKVVLDQPLLGRVGGPLRPKGDFIAVDVGAKAEPSRYTLGAGVDVLFIPWSEMATA